MIVYPVYPETVIQCTVIALFLLLATVIFRILLCQVEYFAVAHYTT